MVKRHLKRLNMPKTWAIKRKGVKFITRQYPGIHKLEEGIPLLIIIKELLEYCKSTKEAKYILNNKEVLVNKIRRRDLKFPVGLFDVVEIPELNEYYLVIINEKGFLSLKKIKKEESKYKLCRVIGKTVLKKGRIQLNLFDGRNLILEKDKYKVGDSILLDLVNGKILKHLKFEKNSLIYLSSGKYIGCFGILKDFDKKIIIVKVKDKEIRTKRDYAIVIGEEIVR